MKKLLLTLSVTALLTACSTSSNMRTGNEVNYTSLKDQRTALRTVQVYDQIPPNAVTMGTVEASRCHKLAYHNPPKRKILIDDLRVSAYAKGADGIANVKIEKVALSGNCWHVLDGNAIAFKLK